MAVVKSDAMLQHEKWISWVVGQNPKRGKEIRMLPEAKELIIAATVVIVVVAAALSIMH